MTFHPPTNTRVSCGQCEQLKAELQVQRDRVAKLAREKSHLQLVADMLSDLAQLSGIQTIANHTVSFLMNSIGGTNVSFYYKLEEEWFCIDVYGRNEKMDKPDDPHVLHAMKTMQFYGVDSANISIAPLTLNIGKSKFQKWIFPLCVDNQVFGALVADGLLIHLHDAVVEQLSIISTYISLVIKSESLTLSRLKAANDKLKKKNRELESEIDYRIQVEREKSRLQSQLQQAQKMEAIGTLAGGIAHDFNNLLGVILGYTDMVLEECTDPQSQLHLEHVVQASERARDLVKQILTFSRKQDTPNAPFYLGPVVKEVMKLIRATIPATITIKFDQDADCPAIFGNASQLHQIVMNLCTNATHAMEKDGGTLEVTLYQNTNGKNQRVVQLAISDSGVGIPKNVLPQIFDPYFTTKEVGKGTGMGLAVVHGIVHSIGGEIFARSEVGCGTTITCEFPALSVGVRESELPESPVYKFSGLAMVVDDEPSIADLAGQMLQKMGFATEIYNNSIDALNAFKRDPQKYTIVFTDQTMPQMSGLQLAQQVLQIRKIPIILCSGYNKAIDEQVTMKQKLAGFIPKPYKYLDLQKALAEALVTPENHIAGKNDS